MATLERFVRKLRELALAGTFAEAVKIQLQELHVSLVSRYNAMEAHLTNKTRKVLVPEVHRQDFRSKIVFFLHDESIAFL